MSENLHEKNRISWNLATEAHNSHKGDQAAFFRNGGTTLFPEELELLGSLRGLDVLHLQCNAGQDSLSIAQLGANVTGVDISDSAIAFATNLSRDSGIPATFYREDLFDYFAKITSFGPKFDLVFSSYGAICWLSDLDVWASGIARSLATGGRFVMVEFHPFCMMFDSNWRLRHDYFDKKPIADGGVPDYVASLASGSSVTMDGQSPSEFENPHPSYEFFWGLGDVVTALARAGLQVNQLDEYPYANGWKGFANLADTGGGRMAVSRDGPRVPLMYRLMATQRN